ncbi:MAG: radical SAM protein [Anaerolineales bacterium]|nr:radical SAM protein [Anaerolineales bacterium]
MSTSRGCPFPCSFCSVPTLYGRRYRFRSIDEIRQEFDSFKGGRFMFIYDDNIVGKFKFAKELFRALIPYKKRWIAQASINVAKDDGLLALAAASGCMQLLIGFESISPTVIDSIGKKQNTIEEYEEAVRKIHSYGIAVHGFFIFGFDQDDASVFESTVNFCRKIKLDTAAFSVLVPYPGTSLHQSLNNEGRILTKDWSQYDDVVFEPKQMSVETLRRGVDWAWREFYRLPSILSRIGRRSPTLSTFLVWVANFYVMTRYMPGRAARMGL